MPATHPPKVLSAALLLLVASTALSQEASTSPAASKICPNLMSAIQDAGFPRDAIKQGIQEGMALVEFTVDTENNIKDVRILRTSHVVFGRHAGKIAMSLSCRSNGQEIKVKLPLSFRAE